jgi:hypothetical protein
MRTTHVIVYASVRIRKRPTQGLIVSADEKTMLIARCDAPGPEGVHSSNTRTEHSHSPLAEHLVRSVEEALPARSAFLPSKGALHGG